MELKENQSDVASDYSSDTDNVTYSQLRLVSKFVKMAGFKGLMDYETEISARDIASIGCDKFNQYTREIDRLFPVHDINLRRTDFKFASETLVMNVMRSLLTAVGVRWSTRRTRNTINLKLVPENEQLDMDIYKKRISLKENAKVEKCHTNVLCQNHLCYSPDNQISFLLSSSDPDCKFLRHGLRNLEMNINVYGSSSQLGSKRLVEFQSEFMESFKNASYTIHIGGNLVYRDLMKNAFERDNLFPVRFVPLHTLVWHLVEICIHTDIPVSHFLSVSDEFDVVLSVKYDKYADPKPSPSCIEDMVNFEPFPPCEIPWVTSLGSNNHLRFAGGLACIQPEYESPSVDTTIVAAEFGGSLHDVKCGVLQHAYRVNLISPRQSPDDKHNVLQYLTRDLFFLVDHFKSNINGTVKISRSMLNRYDGISQISITTKSFPYVEIGRKAFSPVSSTPLSDGNTKYTYISQDNTAFITTLSCQVDLVHPHIHIDTYSESVIEFDVVFLCHDMRLAMTRDRRCCLGEVCKTSEPIDFSELKKQIERPTNT